MITGEQIRKARLARGWSQTFLAEKIGVSTEAVSAWEREKYVPDEINTEALIDVLGLDYLEKDGTPKNGRLFNAGGSFFHEFSPFLTAGENSCVKLRLYVDDRTWILSLICTVSSVP